MQAYLHYANISWASNHKTKLKKVQSKRNHALRVILNQSKTSSSEPLFLSINVLKVIKLTSFKLSDFSLRILTG